MTCSEEVLDAISNLGLGEQPSAKVLLGCEQFLTSHFRPTKVTTSSAKELRWHLFKGNKEDQGVNRLPPTPGVWAEHIKRAHLQANIWSQDVILNPENPDPLTLGWRKEDDKFVPVVSNVPPAPDSVLQLVRCSCQSVQKCSRRCSCKSKKLVCTELCTCTGDETCCNTNPPTIGNDIEDT